MTHPLGGPGDGGPELSCYTANLVALLDSVRPGFPERFASAVHLAVRPLATGATESPETAALPAAAGEAGGAGATRAGTALIAFSHHPRLDVLDDGESGHRELGYRHASDWIGARAGLRAELDRFGQVLAVANSALLPWAPAGPSAVPHWVRLLDAGRDGWLVEDRFAALLPHGPQPSFHGRLGEPELARMLTPVSPRRAEVRLRDELALGTYVPVPMDAAYSWLAFGPARPPHAARAADPADGWITAPDEVFGVLAELLADDASLLGRHLEDLWAASRHQLFRLGSAGVRAQMGEEAADRAAAAWSELPMVLRFASASARRGKPRAGLVRKAFAQLAEATADAPGAGLPVEAVTR
ncbi:hypothetical protein GCM10010302_02640 [Streptomyces polychromogenes]|uniref:Uncharacterized protein n=1 Tax=Streptomyces polychromogenes TaxID=67342 RepID=A0ABP3EMU4_9ACTN